MAWIGRRPPARLTSRTALRARSRSTTTASVPSSTTSCTFSCVTSYRSSRNGSAASRSPWARGASMPSSHSFRPTPNRPSAPRSSTPCRVSSAQSRCTVVRGSPVVGSELGEGLPALGRVLEGAEERQRTPEDGPPCHVLLAHAPSDQPEYPAADLPQTDHP